MDTILQQVQLFARNAHGMQMRKYANELYIEHPIRVMKICQQYSTRIPLLSAALLHDVLEDTQVNENELKEFLSGIMPEGEANKTIQLVVELTDIYTSEKYPEWNRKKRKQKESERLAKVSGNAQTVKYADLMDNSRDVVHSDMNFAHVYLREALQLLKVITSGNRQLYEEAVHLVTECSHQLNSRENR